MGVTLPTKLVPLEAGKVGVSTARHVTVGADDFAALGVPIVAGRAFSDDASDAIAG